MLNYVLEDPVTTDMCLMPQAKKEVQLQFFGEYLHSYEDTFSHRDQNNKPYDAVFPVLGDKWGLGTGHVLGGHNPDYTYNHDGWQTNESRTLEMETEVWGSIEAYFGDPNKATDLEKLKPYLEEFNHIDEEEPPDPSQKDSVWLTSKKVAVLQRALNELGYTGINLTDTSTYAYNLQTAEENRQEWFDHLDQQHYDHAILNTKAVKR